MYTKFNYCPNNYFYNSEINPYLDIGREIYEKQEKEVRECLSEYIREDGVIKGNELKEHWFSISNKDIFISHSHRDLEKVKAFAGWLHEKFGLETFIDSCSWGYCDNLLKKIDNKYCYNRKKETYNYNLRNYTTSHVHMMLSTALTEMIDKTECIIFFNTPRSIILSDEIDNIKNKQITISPWIYHELSMTTMLRTRKPERLSETRKHFDIKSSVIVEYDVDSALKEMVELSDDNLIQWDKNYSEHDLKVQDNALDVLYEIVYHNNEK